MDTVTKLRIADALIKETDAEGSIEITAGVYLDYDGAYAGKSSHRIDTDDGHTIPIADSSDLAYELTEVGYSLLDAARYQHPKVVKILCDAGVDVNEQSQDGNTALHYVAGAKDAESTKELLAAGADATLVNRRGEKAEDVAKGKAKDILITERVEREREMLRQVVGLNDTEEPVQRSRRM